MPSFDGDPRRRPGPSDRAGHPVGRGARRREIHHHPGRISAIRSPRNGSTACGAAEARAPSRAVGHMKKGTRRSGSPYLPNLPKLYFRWFDRCLFISNMLTRSLPPKIFFSVVVGHDFPFVLRVLQVVLADVIPHLRNHLAARQRRAAGDLREIRRRLNRAGQSAPCFTTSPLCHQALLLFLSW